jgi:hypothetical protein
MEQQRPEGGRVEDDFMQPLTPMKTRSPRRLAASLPMAIGAILLVGAVAFGAGAIAPIIVPDESPIVVGDEPTPEPTVEPTAEPTPVPTPSPTAEPTEPVVVDLELTAALSGTKVVLTWTAYDGPDFFYYKVVRSSDPEASWPLGEGDKLVAAIGDPEKLTFTDAPPTGATWYYQVFAVTCGEDGYVPVAVSNVATIAVPKPTPKPVPNCSMSLSAQVIAPTAMGDGVAMVVEGSGYKVKLNWTKYACDMFEGYIVIRSETNSKLDGPVDSGDPDVQILTELGSINNLSWTDTSAQPGHTYYYRVLAMNWSEACYGGIVLGRSNIVKVTIPAATE